MKMLIDADACPVVDICIDCAGKHDMPVWLICDTAHQMDRDGASTIVVTRGADSADFRLVNLIQPGDLVITQDYGLAAMSLARKARVLHQSGMRYTDDNIDSLLLARHTARKVRMAGGRMRGPAKRTRTEDEAFRAALLTLLREEPQPTAGSPASPDA
ncbi:MAG: YaiI/YqxD family protein [Clostridiales bacterium]|nr:YaiI/YqxD family protein [Clostridiales bacterium]